MIPRYAAPLAALGAAALLLAGCTGSPSDGGSTAPAGDGMDALIAAAQEEGELTFYLTPPESTAQLLADAFADEYDIDVNFVRLTGGELATRYQAEADAGAVVADVIMPSYGPFFQAAQADGLLVPMSEAGVPGFEDYPAEGLIDSDTPIVQISPSAVSWNTDALGDTPPPADFSDLADPAYAGKVLLTDPSASPAYLQFWTLMIDTYGEDTVAAIVANKAQYFPSVVPMTEALGAGEGAVTGPNVGGVVAGAAGNGAPVDFAIPDVTTGPQIVVGISTDAPSPNAARLFAAFAMSSAGQDIINRAPGDVSPLHPEDIPSGFTVIPIDEALANQDLIYGIFGV